MALQYCAGMVKVTSLGTDHQRGVTEVEMTLLQPEETSYPTYTKQSFILYNDNTIREMLVTAITAMTSGLPVWAGVLLSNTNDKSGQYLEKIYISKP